MKIALATLLLLLATAIGFAEVLSVLDPVGTKMADDRDPWGVTRTPWSVHATSIGMVIALVGGAVFLLRVRKKH